MSSFLMQFYENKSVPKLIIINAEINDKKLIEETLSKKENSTISINTAKKGSKAKVIAMAEKKCQRVLE
jgi:excinuclease ABC subunit C